MAITVPEGLFDKYREAADFFIDNTNIGQNCTLIYPPKKISCTNCTVSHFGGSSKNRYRHGGPAPFNFGNCPLCGGNGFKEQEVTGSVRLRIYWRPKDWIKVSTVNVPDAEAQIIGYLSDLPNIRKANELLLISDQTHGDFRFQLAGEAFPWGFGKNRYFVAFLRRV